MPTLELDKVSGKFEIRAQETPEELASRLRREEADATHGRRTRAGVLAVVLIVWLVAFGVAIQTTSDPTRQLMGSLVTLIFGAVGGYAVGKGDR